MVATRNHPTDFQDEQPPATASPTKRSTRASTAEHTSPTEAAAPPQALSSTRTSASAAPTHSSPSSTTTPSTWSHTPSNATLIWLAISLPLVIWDTGYVMLRPYSMPGGSLHSPIWKPYGLYGTIDHVYGFKAWEAHNGWTLAQGSVNALETVAYLLYLYAVYTYGRHEEGTQGRGAPDAKAVGGEGGALKALTESRTVRGRLAVQIVLLGYSTAFLTFSKTVLYWLTEAFSGFDNIGHNDWFTLVFMWIIPNGAWIILPAYMIYVFGQEILQGLEIAAKTESGDKKSR